MIIVGGKGWGEDDINSVVKQLDIEKYVQILGYLSDKELTSVYQEASMLIMPSLYEGFGLPLLEAMSVGVPVVTSNTSSMPEIVGDAAVLVDPYNVDSIKKGIEKVLTDSKLRSKLSDAGYEQSKLFSWEKAAKETLLAFEEASIKHKENYY